MGQGYGCTGYGLPYGSRAAAQLVRVPRHAGGHEDRKLGTVARGIANFLRQARLML